jgi:RNA polymerase sigma factor (TIGR02999 family)
MSASQNNVTQLLIAWSNGDEAARNQLMPIVYQQSHRLAHRHIKKERPAHTLQTSALLNEAFLRLVDQRHVHWKSRAHFFGIASQMMRRILVDYARRRRYGKRGANARQVTLGDDLVVTEQRSAEVVALDDALTGLAAIDPRQSQLVELRFFGGLSIAEPLRLWESRQVP